MVSTVRSDVKVPPAITNENTLKTSPCGWGLAVA
ncbi:hypothetical protein Q31a_11360 [Aureliella helgolandensis]|uniref:Uncharacterized protein n=1 Tax=Aureliella helgolandensis TaxID=2527968 RepID=A0A518G2N0_9BACT|nr:hypothetical protein Q31a_11360 [Aureliella helgolandensis]